MTLIVCGERIEDSQIQQEVERLRPHYEEVFKDKPPEEREAQLFKWSRENVIERVILEQEARRNGKEATPQEVEGIFVELKNRSGGGAQLEQLFGTADEGSVKKQIEQNIKVQKLLDENCGQLSEPSRKEISEFYSQNKEQFTKAERIRVSHIEKRMGWKADETQAYEVMLRAWDELQDGKLFEDVAAKYSDCPHNGGDIGYITRGQMVEEFEDVVFNLGVNVISDIFRTRFGFHIAKVYDRKPSYIPALEEVREQIIDELENHKHDKAIDDYIDGLKSKAGIEEL